MISQLSRKALKGFDRTFEVPTPSNNICHSFIGVNSNEVLVGAVEDAVKAAASSADGDGDDVLSMVMALGAVQAELLLGLLGPDSFESLAAIRELADANSRAMAVLIRGAVFIEKGGER